MSSAVLICQTVKTLANCRTSPGVLGERYMSLSAAEYRCGTEIALKASQRPTSCKGLYSRGANTAQVSVSAPSCIDRLLQKGNARLPHADITLWIYNSQLALNSCNVCAAFTVWFTCSSACDNRNPLISEAWPRWFRVAERDRVIHWRSRADVISHPRERSGAAIKTRSRYCRM